MTRTLCVFGIYMASYRSRFHVVLYQPEIPPNTGAVGRTCVAFEAKLWLVRPLGFRTDQKTLRRAGLDYWQHLDWEIVDDWTALRTRLPQHDRYWYFSKTATRSLIDAPFAEGDVLVFGSETAGLPPTLLASGDDRCLRIPTSHWVRSLNLSCAVAVAAFHLAGKCEFFFDVGS